MASFQHIAFEKERGRARITLNRPEKHNAISGQMQRELHQALWEADADPEVHAMLIRGAGPSFCAGFDLTGYEEIREGARREGATASTTMPG